MRTIFGRVLAGIGLVLAAAAPATAQDAANWPNRSIRLIVPTTAGGGNDAAARHLAEALSRSLKQPVVVQNVPGAGNMAGTAQVAKAKPDGYTLLSTGVSAITISPHVYAAALYKPDDLAPVSQLNESSQVLVVNAKKLPATNLSELLDLIKKNAGKSNYGSNGIGSIGHLAMELFQMRTGTKVNHVPFKGGNDVVTALLGGHVDLAFNNTTSVLGQLKDGSLRAIAVPSSARVAELPNVALLSETVPNFGAFSSWIGIFAPRGTPAPIIARLNEAIAAYARTPEAVEFTKASGAEIVASKPDQFAAIIKRDSAMWAEVVKAIGLKLE